MRDASVTDIYIDGPLGFQCKKIAAAKKNVKIRMSPTVSPNSVLAQTTRVNSLYVRPEDISLYSEAVDVIDFELDNQEQEDALFSIYSRGNFYFSIDNLIKGLNCNIYNVLFNEEFGKTRANCGQRCKEPGHFCHYCDNYFTLMRQS